MSADTPMMQQYRRIKDQQRDAILFFRLGDFYEMFFHDAKEAAAVLGLTLTQRNGVPMCGVPYHAANTYIPRLLRAGKKIAICEQTQLPAAGSKLATREVTQVISPGIITEQDFLDSNRDNYLVAVCRQATELCMAWIDISTGRFELHSYPWEQAVPGLRQELARLAPRELIVQESLLETPVGEVLRSSRDVVVNRYPDWLFSVEESYRRLTDYFGTTNLRGFGLDENDPGLAPAGIVLEYIQENAGSRLSHVNSIGKLRDGDFVPLDEATQRNLELVENLQDGGTEFTLFRVLNYTETAMGARALARWLKQPLRRIDPICDRQQRVAQLYHHQTTLSEIRECIAGARDLERLGSKIGMGRCNPREMEAVGATLAVVLQLQDLLARQPELLPVFPVARESGEAARKLHALIAHAIADNPPTTPGDGGCIRTGFDAEVDRLRQLHDNSGEILQDYIRKLQQETGIPSLKVKYNRILGHFIEVTRTHRDKVPESFIPRQSLTQSDRFTTTELNRIESSLNSAEQNLIDRELEVYADVRSQVEDELAELQRIAALLGELDALQSLAQAATIHGYVQPRLDSSRKLSISGGRHPVVEQHLPPGDFVPNSVELSEPRFALITGPNMAGKSTYLRQAALIVLMAQIGSFVPANDAHIGVVDNLFCRVGARDNLARGESTFLVEMSETAHILRTSSDRSLIIMDEVGRGTSSTDGQAIAHAVCDYILNHIRARTLFATHYHQLSMIEHPDFTNLSLSVVENGSDIVFLREIQDGPSNHSYGIQAARLAGVPKAIIAAAEQFLLQMEPENQGELPRMVSPADPAAVPAAAPPDSLFSVETEAADMLRNTDPDSITPLQALQLVAQLREKLLSG
ncbi:DNA mismatch repair protein MutS [Spirochaeta africana]|uniref:DNA mismatch repair protein MutS n=1 Tax=Spirochaeta africana (strain ATCC 700263 / DSM 8902 / Z-7692) TaxID=889378 RepID=H9UJB0_SPIAZ|nr:DNA mismatch repair protein MutS [Spirochaeta africana]AFG37603.1 DNA mismatch repair protein MutS [Spirochaeta africana DSM 8902]